MKLNLLIIAALSAVCLAGGIPVQSYGQDSGTAEGESPEEKPPANYSEVVRKIQKLGRKLTRESTLAEVAAHHADAFKVMADYMRANPEATDMWDLYQLAFFRAYWGGANEDFLQISEAYLKQYPDDDYAKDWKVFYLAGCLSSDSRKEKANKELEAIEKAAKEDVGKALDAACIRVLDASIRKDVEASSKAVKAMKSDEKLMAHLEKDQELRNRIWNFVLGFTPVTVKEGEKLTDWATVLPVQDVQGKDISLADYAGKPTLIVFWSLRGKYSVAELPNVVKAYGEFKEKGFDVIGVNVDSLPADEENSFQEAIEGKGEFGKQTGAMPWRHICAGSSELGLGKMYGALNPPRNILIDKDGKVVARNLWGEKLIEQLSTMLPDTK